MKELVCVIMMLLVSYCVLFVGAMFVVYSDGIDGIIATLVIAAVFAVFGYFDNFKGD